MSRHVGGGLAAAAELFGPATVRTSARTSSHWQALLSRNRPAGVVPAGSATRRRSPSTSAPRNWWLEQARLTLRARYGMAVDRGRIVREAIAAMLADSEASADDSELVRRLSTS